MMRKGEGAPRPGELRPEARFTLASFRRHRTGERRHWPDVPPDGFDRPRRECRAGRRAYCRSDEAAGGDDLVPS